MVQITLLGTPGSPKISDITYYHCTAPSKDSSTSKPQILQSVDAEGELALGACLARRPDQNVEPVHMSRNGSASFGTSICP